MVLIIISLLCFLYTTSVCFLKCVLAVLRTTSVEDNKCWGQQVLRTTSVEDNKCWGQQVLRITSIEENKCWGQQVFRTTIVENNISAWVPHFQWSFRLTFLFNELVYSYLEAKRHGNTMDIDGIGICLFLWMYIQIIFVCDYYLWFLFLLRGCCCFLLRWHSWAHKEWAQ